MSPTESFASLFDKAQAVFEARRSKEELKKLRGTELNDLANEFGYLINAMAPDAVELPFSSEQFDGQITLSNSYLSILQQATVTVRINNPQTGEEPYDIRYFIPYRGTVLKKEVNWNGEYVAVPLDEYRATLELLKDILGLASKAIRSQSKIVVSIDPDPAN